MADVVISSTDSIIAWIDNTGAYPTMQWAVEHNAGGAGNQLLVVREAGNLVVGGPLTRAGPVIINNSASGNIADFRTGTTQVAAIEASGLGDFSTGGVQLPVVTSAPASGLAGDLILIDDSTNYMLHVYDGTSWVPL